MGLTKKNSAEAEFLLERIQHAKLVGQPMCKPPLTEKSAPVE
jgi:hypothetical protein